MKLNEVLASEELSDALKIEKIAAIVDKARAAYGNCENEIDEPEINTVSGLQDLAMLCNESKLAVVESEISNIKTIAIEFTKAFQGAKLDKKIEELIAISPILTNIAKTVDSEYI